MKKNIILTSQFFFSSFTACFRRVLAGKRIASHWIRRTLICERLEDCQRECADEKRFTCEGFNYRLDHSGRGQGDCELIEVSLAKMDLYSSQHNRDSNLIPHPDYDYYERDRTSSNCRSSCSDCGSARPPPPSNYRPQQQQPNNDRYGRPEITALDKYRPQHNFYEPRPEPADNWDRYGGSNYYANNYDRPQPPPPGYGGDRFSIDRYGVEDSSASVDYPRPPPVHRPPPPADNYHRPDPPARPLPPSDNYHRPDPPPPVRPADNYHRPDPPARPAAPEPQYSRPQAVAPLPPMDYNRPDPMPYRPAKPSDYDRPDAPYHRPPQDHPPPSNSGYGSVVELHHGGGGEPSHNAPPRPGIGFADREPSQHKNNYHPTNFHQKPFIPYLIGQENWGQYGGNYGSQRPPMNDYWGLKNEIKRKDGPNFNYYELGPHEENSVYNRYGGSGEGPHRGGQGGAPNWAQMWTRRPGTEGE